MKKHSPIILGSLVMSLTYMVILYFMKSDIYSLDNVEILYVFLAKFFNSCLWLYFGIYMTPRKKSKG